MVGVEGIWDAGLERLKVICSREDGRTKRVSVSRSHWEKRIGECICSVSIQFKRIRVLNLTKSFILLKLTFFRDY